MPNIGLVAHLNERVVLVLRALEDVHHDVELAEACLSVNVDDPLVQQRVEGRAPKAALDQVGRVALAVQLPPLCSAAVDRL